jgi:DNA-binding NarL/FixJ family response regulator
MVVPTRRVENKASEEIVLVVTGEGSGVLEAFAKQVGVAWKVSLARDYAAALGAVERTAPSVAIVGPELGTGLDDGLELCRQLRAVARELCLVLVIPTLSANQRVRALKIGVDDCLPHPVDPEELRALVAARIGAIQRRSDKYRIGVPATVTQRVHELTRSYGLSPREAQILVLVTRGVHPKEAAARLGCGYSTARTHLRRLAKKLGCNGTRDVLVRFFNCDFEA